MLTTPSRKAAGPVTLGESRGNATGAGCEVAPMQNLDPVVYNFERATEVIMSTTADRLASEIRDLPDAEKLRLGGIPDIVYLWPYKTAKVAADRDLHDLL